MLQYDPLHYLPTAEDLPDSDETPVDNEFQNLIPNLLLSILTLIWAERTDWFFAVDMGIPIVPDGFLSLGVERFKRPKGRPSYIVWQENDVVPKLVLEVVSETYGGEYDDKFNKYVSLGVLYYVIYNPDFWQRHKHEPFEVYRLVEGKYVLQQGNPLWMPEIGLGIGSEQGSHSGWTREWLYWYDPQGHRYPTQEERVEQADHRAERLAERLRQMGVDPNIL